MLTKNALSADRLRLLYDRIQQEFAPIACRELLCAAAGLKCSRLMMGSHAANWLEAVLTEFGLCSARSHARYLLRQDVGKGGWCSGINGEVPPEDERGYWKLYVGSSLEAVHQAKEAESDGGEQDFSDSLSIPDCCARFYEENKKAAQREQDDYVMLTFRQSEGAFPFSYWNNYVAQFFGYSLISFFPCSFHCDRSATAAQASYQFLQRVAPELAEQTLYYHRQSILYTEYQGVYLFEGARFECDRLHYDPERIRATVPSSELLDQLRLGDRLHLTGRTSVSVQAGSKTLTSVGGEHVAPCIF